MTNEEKNKLGVEITAARQMLNAVPFAKATLKKFVSLLDDLPYADCSQAIDRHLNNPETKFPPTPADIRRICKEIAEEREEANYKPYLERHPEENKTPEQRREIAKKLRAVLDKFNRVVADDDAKDGFTIRKAVSGEEQ